MREKKARMEAIRKRTLELRHRRDTKTVYSLSGICILLSGTLSILLRGQIGESMLSVQENCSAILLDGCDGAYFVTAMFAFIFGAVIALCGVRLKKKTQFVSIWEEKRND